MSTDPTTFGEGERERERGRAEAKSNLGHPAHRPYRWAQLACQLHRPLCPSSVRHSFSLTVAYLSLAQGDGSQLLGKSHLLRKLVEVNSRVCAG